MNTLRKRHEQNNDGDQDILHALNLLENELSRKKYGLIWEDHLEETDYTLSTNLPVLTELIDLAVDNGGQQNFLLEGDNLAALDVLRRTHPNKVNVIYIDPPYNTNNRDFMYGDSFVEATDAFRHSKWLSFMSRRLIASRAVLSEDGAIFISINNYEFGPLKLLCDEIFSESNFVGCLTWESTTQPINSGSARFQLQQKTEYIYCYAKNKSSMPEFLLEMICGEQIYPHIGKHGPCRFEIIEKSDAGQYRRDSMKFKILGQPPREGKRWQIGEATARELEAAGKVEIIDGIVKKAVYPEDEMDKLSFRPFWSHLPASEVGTAKLGKKELNTVLNTAVGFDTVKPISLIKELLSHFHRNSIILDFFAGLEQLCTLHWN